MLKHRIIGSFVAVWCAVCLLYVGVRTARGAMLGTTVDAEVTNTTTTQTPNAPEEAKQAPSSAGTATTQEEPTTAQDKTATAKDEPTTQSKATEPAAAEKPANQIVDTTPELVEPNSTNKQPNDTEANASEDEDLEQGTQEAEALNIPSLSEYLSSYTCGSCRRNCTLDNPRCHNGSRLAEAKAQEYYELYG